MLRKFFSLPILGRRSVSKTFTSSDPRNEFPVFGDGDFELRLSQKPEDRFVLHSECLIANSPYFKACMSDRWAISEKPTGIIKWRYELRFDEEFEFGLLERIVC